MTSPTYSTTKDPRPSPPFSDHMSARPSVRFGTIRIGMRHNVPDSPHQRPAGDPRVAETRGVVLTAARCLIADEGPDAVTPTRLSAMTGVSRSTIYRHWQDPRAIIFEATASDTTRPPFEATGEPLDDLRSYLEALREGLKGTQGALLATQIDRAEHDDEASDAMRRISTQRREMIGHMLAEPPDGFGALHALIVGPLIFQRYLDRGDIGDELIDMIVEVYATTRDRRHPHRSSRDPQGFRKEEA